MTTSAQKNDIPWEDSLLALHAYASHLPRGLSQGVSTYCDAAPWKLTAKNKDPGAEEKGLLPQDMSADDLRKYGAADAKLTALMWQRLQPDLEKERAVYEHDKQLAEFCSVMQVEGIGVDRERARELDGLLARRSAAMVGRMRSISGVDDFNPASTHEVRRVLFRTLRARWSMPTPSGLPSTSEAALEALRTGGTRAARVADVLLRWRTVDKIRSTYLASVALGRDQRAHFSWKLGTVSGRLSCRLQSCPRFDPSSPEGRIREIYVPRPGNALVYFDVSQIEMRFAAYLSADPVFMQACEGDVHANNAKLVWPDMAARGWLDGDAKKDPARGKKLRDIAKNFGFAIGYGAEADKLYITLARKGLGISLNACSRILGELRARFRVYFAWAAKNLAFCKAHGFLRSPLLGRIRWLGWWPKPTDVMNFPIQSTAADIVNRRCIEMLPHALALGAAPVIQVHDAVGWDCPVGHAEKLKKMLAEQWAEPIPTPGGKLILPIDLKCGKRWSELG